MDVVQLVEHRIVVPSVVGSSPIIHPSLQLSEESGSCFVFRGLGAGGLLRLGARGVVRGLEPGVSSGVPGPGVSSGVPGPTPLTAKRGIFVVRGAIGSTPNDSCLIVMTVDTGAGQRGHLLAARGIRVPQGRRGYLLAARSISAPQGSVARTVSPHFSASLNKDGCSRAVRP